MAISLGADVPMCLHGETCFAGGIGEVIEPAPVLPKCALVLVNPGVSLATPDVFRARSGDFSAPARFDNAARDAQDLAELLGARRNDLEAPAMALAPVIGDVLQALEGLPGCRLARMSGSGATCFGLFAETAAAAFVRLTRKESAAAPKPHWWTDESLLEVSRQAVEAAPESGGAWQMRATVLGSMEE